MIRFIPILTWLPQYKREYLKGDIVAGLTVAVMLIPQGMAYAMLAGLPPIKGLYAAMMALTIYAIMGTSKQLSVGPLALDSLLVAAGLSLVAAQGTNEYILLAALLAVMVGIIQILMGLLRLGFLVNFLSQPLISGFTSAAAIIISFSQLKYILGIDIPGSQQIYKIIWFTLKHLGGIHWLTFAIGLGSFGALLIFKRWKASFPGALVVIILTSVLVATADLHGLGVAVVGMVPRGLPGFSIPHFDLKTVEALFPTALVIGFISYTEAIVLAKRFAAKNRYKIDANQELIGLGLANVTSGLGSGYPISGSFSRTAINAQAGAQSGLSSFFTAVVIAFTLLFLTPLFQYIPTVALAAIVIVAVSSLIDVKEAIHLYRLKKRDFTVLLFAFGATLLFGVRYGILLSVIAALLLIIRRISHPRIAILGQIPGTDIFRNIKRVPEAAKIPGLIIFRMDASLFFANASYFEDMILKHIAKRQPGVKAVLVDASTINDIDATADAALHQLVDDLRSQGIDLYFTNVRGPVRDMMQRSGFYNKLGNDHFFFSKKDAVRYYISKYLKNTPQEPAPQLSPGPDEDDYGD